jgi:hypothetical protein
MKVVYVEWMDASADNTWTHIEHVEAPTKLTNTVGFLVKETEEFVILAHTYDEETAHVNGVMNLPIEMVRTLRVIWPAAKKK